jgi:hypothetical protein
MHHIFVSNFFSYYTKNTEIETEYFIKDIINNLYNLYHLHHPIDDIIIKYIWVQKLH